MSEGEGVWTQERLDETSTVHKPGWKSIHDGVFNKSMSIDKIGLGSEGLNPLHFAAVALDIPLLHASVQIGAALDFPTMTGHALYPPGLTALHLSILSVATLPPAWRQVHGVGYMEANLKRGLMFIETLLRYGWVVRPEGGWMSGVPGM